MEGKPPPQLNRRWLPLCLGIGLLAGAAWFGLRSALPPTGPSPPAAAAIPVQPRVATRPVANAHSASLAAGEGAKVGDRETVVCGVGTVRVDSNEQAAPFNYVDRLTRSAQSRWRQTLLNSDDDHQRAAGLLLRAIGWDYDPITHMPRRTHEAGLARDELVQLAVGLNDVPIYAIAVQACDPMDDGGVRGAACERISLSQWAEMDSDNAAPWLGLARAAHARGDRAAESEAVRHAAQAHTINFYNDSLLAYAIPGMPSATSALERAAFVDEHTGHVGGDGFARSFASHTYCSAKAVEDPDIHAQCDALAEVFANHGRSTFDLDAAARIGRRLGWPADRITAMEQEMLAVFRVEGHSGEDP